MTVLQRRVNVLLHVKCLKELYVLKNLKMELPYDPTIPHLGIYPKEVKAGTRRDICEPMFTAVLFTIAKRWRQPKCPWMDGWIHSVGSIHTVENDSAMKRCEALTQATTWMDLEDMMLSERCQI